MIIRYLFFCLLFTSYISAQDVSDIVDKTYTAYRYQGDDVVADALMEIKDKSGATTQTRELLIVRKNVKGSRKQKWYTYFKRPADIRKMVFMVWKNPEKDDNRWLYLPALDLVKRISGSDKRSSFAGSHFVYEDVTGRDPSLDHHELVSETDAFYILKSTPKPGSQAEFSYYETQISKEHFLPMQRSYYDNNGALHRIYKTEKIETLDGFPATTVFSMSDVQKGTSTVITMSDIRYNVGVNDRLFTESQIRRTPREYLRR